MRGATGPSRLVISLDFELHWGGVEKWNLSTAERQCYFRNTRRVIPGMLDVFAAHQVHVTWATVGLLFCGDKKEILDTAPIMRPGYHRTELSSYTYMDCIGIGADESSDPYHYGRSLLEEILKTPGMEVGSHTFSHFYADEPGQTSDEFRADLQAAQVAAGRMGLKLHSLVMPRNQIVPEYLAVCAEEGFTSIRINPKDWYWQIPSVQPETVWKRINRFADAYVPNGHRTSYPLDALMLNPGEPLRIPASRLLRPYDARLGPLNRMRLRRIMNEMTDAARNGEVYHLWWHPHNFGSFPDESLKDLAELLEHYADLYRSYGMLSCTMGELTDAFKLTRS